MKRFALLLFLVWAPSLFGQSPSVREQETNNRSGFSSWAIRVRGGGGSQSLPPDREYLTEQDRTLEQRILYLSLQNPDLSTPAAYYLLRKENLPGRPTRSGSASMTHFGLENQQENFVFHFGYTGASYNFRSNRNPLHYILLAQSSSLLPSVDTPEGRSLIDYLIYENELEKQQRKEGFRPAGGGAHYDLNLLEGGIGFHFLPDATFDPFVEAGVRSGFLNSRGDSPAWGGYVAAGVRYNYERLYLSFGLEHQSMRMKSGSRTTGWIPTNTIRMGAGIFL